MNKKNLLDVAVSNLELGQNTKANYDINGAKYDITVYAPDFVNGIRIPYIVAIPQKTQINKQIMLEVNNRTSDNMNEVLEQAVETVERNAKLTDNKPCPIIIPVLPDKKGSPYFQQLSRECFELKFLNSNYRIDEQIVRIINKTKNELKSKKGITLDNKIFLNGYSSSGVFAQRFALIYPELIDTACIGGASGSIPIPSDQIGYPIGIKDYKKLFGKDFNEQEYSKIKFRYYVGELETINKDNSRFDDNGNYALMHDMSFYDRSVPSEVGKDQRKLFGKEMFARAQNTIAYLENKGIDIEHFVIPGRTHSKNSGHGIDEIGDKFLNDKYLESIKSKSISGKIKSFFDKINEIFEERELAEEKNNLYNEKYGKNIVKYMKKFFKSTETLDETVLRYEKFKVVFRYDSKGDIDSENRTFGEFLDLDEHLRDTSFYWDTKIDEETWESYLNGLLVFEKSRAKSDFVPKVVIDKADITYKGKISDNIKEK